MASVTSTPADLTLSLGLFSTSKSGNITWTAPTVPDGVIITSVKLTGTVTASNSGVSSITLNGQSLTVSTSGASFTIDLGTDNSKTSLSAEAKKTSSFSSYTVTFSNMVYTVEYTQTYTVIFKDEEGNIIKTVNNVKNNESISNIEPEMSKEGYSFVGWKSEDDGNVKYKIYSDLTLIAYFEKDPIVTVIQNDGGYFTYNNTNYEGNQTFNLKYRDDFVIDINSKTGYVIAYFDTKQKNSRPHKQPHGGTAFGLSIDLSSDITINIHYEKQDAVFTVIFEDIDGTELKKIENVTIASKTGNSLKPENPTRQGYNFTKWVPDIDENIVENTTFVAQYSMKPSITIRQTEGCGYFTYNGVQYTDAEVYFDLTAGSSVDMIFTANEGYMITLEKVGNLNQIDFVNKLNQQTSNWGYDNIQEAALVEITYTNINSEFNVSFTDKDGTVLKNEVVPFNGTATAPDTSNLDKPRFRFKGWEPSELTNITCDTTFVAQYTECLSFTVDQEDHGYIVYKDKTYRGKVFFNVDEGSNLGNMEVYSDEGYIISYTELSFVVGDIIDPFDGGDYKRQTHYTQGFNNITYNVLLKIKQLPEDTIYTVTFKDYDNTIVKTENVLHFNNATAPEIVNKRSGYKFTGWSPDISDKIVHDTTFVAQYSEALTVTIKQNKGGYFVYNNKEYRGNTVLDFTDDGQITTDIEFHCDEGYNFASFYHPMDGFNNEEEQLSGNTPFSEGWQGIQDNQFLKIGYIRISSVNKENIIINNTNYKSAYIGTKPVKIYRGEDRIL